MKFGKYEIILSKQSKPGNTSGVEQGSSGTAINGYFPLEQGLGARRNPSIRQIMYMLDEDGTAAALYNVISFPVMATNWHIVPDPEDVLEVKNPDGTTRTTHPQADFIENCLRSPQHKGGMSTPFSLVLSDILLAVAQGYRIFEIVYKLDDEKRVVFQKIVSREDQEVLILTDDTGGFSGFRSLANGNKGVVEIDLPYAFLFTYRKDRHKLRGLSAFRPGFYHYDKKHRLYYLANQQGQVAAMPFKVLDSPEDADPKDRSANLAAVDKMAVRPSIALPFGWKLNIVQPGKSYDLLPYMDHHDTQMARAVLAQGMLLGGTTGSKGGSFALSESHADMFKLGELALMSNIEEHITAYLISKLHDFNFDKPLYSTFKFDEITDEVQNLMTAAFKGLVDKGNVPDWIADGISEKVADQMEIIRPTDADDSKKSALGSSAASSNTPAVTQSRKKKDTRLAKSEWWRELTAAEAKVQFSTIDKKADDAEQSMVDSLKPVFDKVSADATKRLKPLLEDKGAKALDGFTLNYSDDLKKVFANHMIDAYSTAKTTAADEINKSAPANKQTSKDLISQHAQAVTEKQFGDLLFNLKAIVTDAVRKNKLDNTELSIGDVIANIANMFSSFFDDKEDLTASALITTAINIGRDDVFQTFSNQIYAYQYSAILDDAVCPICADLDSSVVTEAEYYSTKWMPPIHFNCRCIWVAIMNDEEDKPEITGLPDAPGGSSTPPSGPDWGTSRVKQVESNQDKVVTTIKTTDDAGKYILDNYKDINYSAKEADSVRLYASDYFRDINKELRGLGGGEIEDIKTQISNIDKAIAKGKLKEDVNLYRGFKTNDKLEVGRIFKDDGFVSTSLSPDAAKVFVGASDQSRATGKVFSVQINAREGQAAAFPDVAKGSSFASEGEVLLPRGMDFKITSVKEILDDTLISGRYFKVEAEIL